MPNNMLRYWREGADDPFEIMFEVAPIMMHSIDENGILLNVSEFWAKKLGYERNEMIGTSSTQYLTQDSRERAQKTVLPNFFRNGRAYNIDYDFMRKNGEKLPILMSAVAQYSDNGDFLRSLAVMFDNTENRRLSAELNHNLRMESLGQLVAGVAHDFNNLLTVIKGNTEFLRSDPDDKNRMDYLRDTYRSAERGASLTQMLLAYGQKSRLQPKRTDLNRIIREMDHMLRRVLPSKIELSVVASGDLWGVEVDPHQLETAVMNVVNNATDAMPKGGKLTVETCNVRISEDYIASRDEDILPGRYVMLAISDTGDGIEDAIQSRIFEPYFTTKPFGQGSGLGLSMVFGYVKQSGGTIRVYSERGFGTSFKLYFPATSFRVKNNETNEQSYSNKPDPLAEILVVEDESDVRRVLVRLIETAGYAVSQASSGDEAFTLLTTGYRPKLLVTDIVMPGALQGPELAEKARDLVDDLKVILVSGRPQEAAIHGSGMLDSDVLINKPIDSPTLLREIARMLTKSVE